MSKTLQQEIANGITQKFKDAVVKKIDKDNYLDIHIPAISDKIGTHFTFTTTRNGIKLSVYSKDDVLCEQFLENSLELEPANRGIRLKNNPTYETVKEAIEGALFFIGELIESKKVPALKKVVPKKGVPQKAVPKNKESKTKKLSQEIAKSIKKNNKNNDFRIQIEGAGSEMKYDILKNKEYKDFLNFKKINEIDNEEDAWIEFINEEKNKEFWDYNGLADFTGILLDELKISVFDKSNDLIFSSSYWGIDEETREDYIEENSINDSEVKGKYIYPKKDNLVVFRSFEDFQFEFNILDVPKFKIEDFGIIRVSSDEIGFGKDYGDYCIGIIYKGESYRPTDFPPQNYKNYEINFECS